MGILDYILVLVIAAGFFTAVAAMIRKSKNGGCAGCTGSCADCGKSRKTKRSYFIRNKREMSLQDEGSCDKL